jgi:hypothetical protein
VARRGERGHVGQLAARHVADRRLTRQAEELAEPFACDVLDDRGRRPADVEAGVLIPGRRKPVSRQRRRHGAADYEAEVAAAGHRDNAAVRVRREFGDHRARRGRFLRQRPSESLTQLVCRRRRKDRPLVERLEEVGGELGGQREQLPGLTHGVNVAVAPASASAASSSSAYPASRRISAVCAPSGGAAEGRSERVPSKESGGPTVV